MAIALEKYQDILDELGEHAGEVMRASWGEAARVFSARGLEAYLHGATGLKSLGRGTDLVVSFVQSAPAVARELGEDAVSDLLAAAIRMYSKTSATVISLIFSSSPIAASRLGDPELFRAYLHLIDTLLAQAPRGVRPMLDHLGTLLGQLTLGGLRRWALWGAQAHKTDFDAQTRYFGLESPESLGVLQKERKGTLFIDVQRRIGMYLRALWGRDFFMRPTSGDFEQREGYRPYIEGYLIHLPDAYDDLESPSGRTDGVELYRAACAHAAAHQMYTKEPLSAEALTPLQMMAIGVVEDARVEQMAIHSFPGLAPLWRKLHHATPDQNASVSDYLNRIARALLDPDYADPDPLIAKARSLFAGQVNRLSSNQLAWDIGVTLAHDLMQMQLPFVHTEVLSALYRDDNRYLWDFKEESDFAQGGAPWQDKQVRKHVSVMEFANEVEVETAGDDAQEIWVLSSELFPYEDLGKSYNELEGKEPPPQPHPYPEWDYQMQLERPAWCTVLEKRPKQGEVKVVDEIVVKHKPIIGRLRHLIEAMQPQGVQRLRKQEDGDEIDLNAAVHAMVEMRMGEQPDPRIMIRNVRKVRDLSVLLLIDLSESTNDPLPDSDNTVLQLAREATVLLADALDKIGDPFAIHGFDSNGRHDVEYFRFKDFDMPHNDLTKSRLAGMHGQLSTRMGAAMRHAGSILKRQPSHKKLLLLITDGEPADNDVRDPQYLRFDAKKAVEELTRTGITTYCLSLDPRADQYVSRIFGARNYMVMDHVQRLPEKLPLLYMGLTR
ncbi:VWA domain-containing protein [Ferrovum sp.]|uniref:nitric oxide reductase activation protein NorD n=1 Tax=Ferrovum sp. TaxID=2609467 RepID=UPI0026306A05|nr:VWA domain-containing protein [Ferrovum sp.]